MARQPDDKTTAKFKSDDSALIRELALLLDETSLTEIEIERAGLRVRVARNISIAASMPSTFAAPAAAPAAAAAAVAPADIAKLLAAFGRLIENGASLLIIEHNLDVIKAADWVIDLGPEGGDRGGYIVATGTPAQIAETPGSYTGQFLQQALALPVHA